MLHESMSTNNRQNSSKTNREVNNRQKVRGNNMPFHKNGVENSQVSDTHMRTRYGRIVRKSDRLMY